MKVFDPIVFFKTSEKSYSFLSQTNLCPILELSYKTVTLIFVFVSLFRITEILPAMLDKFSHLQLPLRFCHFNYLYLENTHLAYNLSAPAFL